MQVYAMTDFKYDQQGVTRRHFSADPGRRFTLKTVKATENTEVTILGQKGQCDWDQNDEGLHITAFNKHTVQIIKTPPESPEAARRDWIWGPDWPVALKITNVTPIER